MRRGLDDGYELDDDRDRSTDVGRPRVPHDLLLGDRAFARAQRRADRDASRVAGLYLVTRRSGTRGRSRTAPRSRTSPTSTSSRSTAAGVSASSWSASSSRRARSRGCASGSSTRATRTTSIGSSGSPSPIAACSSAGARASPTCSRQRAGRPRRCRRRESSRGSSRRPQRRQARHRAEDPRERAVAHERVAASISGASWRSRSTVAETDRERARAPPRAAASSRAAQEVDALRRGEQLDRDDVGELRDHRLQPPRRERRHADVVFLVGGGRQAVDAGRMRERLVLATPAPPRSRARS